MTLATFTKHFTRRLAHATLLGAALFSSTPVHADTRAAGEAPEAQTSAQSSAQTAPSLVVDLNAATAAELEQLPGIGPSRAQAILALRAQLKRFNKIEDLMRVKGIGRATFRKLRPMLKVGAQSAEAKSAETKSAK